MRSQLRCTPSIHSFSSAVECFSSEYQRERETRETRETRDYYASRHRWSAEVSDDDEQQAVLAADHAENQGPKEEPRLLREALGNEARRQVRLQGLGVLPVFSRLDEAWRDLGLHARNARSERISLEYRKSDARTDAQLGH